MMLLLHSETSKFELRSNIRFGHVSAFRSESSSLSLSQIGPKWRDVVSRCIKGHYQPLLLLYADPRGTPVSVQDLTSRLDLHHYTKTYYDSEDSGR